jgi:hypothetical protein
MHPLMTEELGEERRRELLRRADRARRADNARRGARPAGARGPARRGWRVGAGLFLVRIGVRLGGDALSDSMVVVPGRGDRPATLAVVWRTHGGDPPRRAGTGRPKGRPPVLSRW